MTSFNPANPFLTAQQCVFELNKLVPKSSDHIGDQDIEALKSKIADLLAQFSSKSSIGQSLEIAMVRSIGRRAKDLNLLSKEAKATLKHMAGITKSFGGARNLEFTDFTIVTNEGPVKANRDELRESCMYFKKLMKKEWKQTRSIEWPYSKKTVDFLMKCLHDPSTKAISLPNNPNLILELIELSASRGFDLFLHKLEPVLTEYIAKHRDTVLENGGAWLHSLSIVKDSHPEIAKKWLLAITPLFLENFEIPFKPSKLPEVIIIPIEHRNAFFNEETREYFKELPLALEIKNNQDLDLFLETCHTNKPETVLPIRLSCMFVLSSDEENSIKKIGEAANIELNMGNSILPPGTKVYGKEEWENEIGSIGEVPPLPEGIAAFLESKCPYYKDKTWKETHMLYILPATVNGRPLSLNYFLELIQHPIGGAHVTRCRKITNSIPRTHGNEQVKSSCWVLMSLNVIDRSPDNPYDIQQKVIKAFSDGEVPSLLPGVVGIATHHIHTGERLFEKNYSRCQEAGTSNKQIIVGGFTEEGFEIGVGLINSHIYGVADMVKFDS